MIHFPVSTAVVHRNIPKMVIKKKEEASPVTFPPAPIQATKDIEIPSLPTMTQMAKNVTKSLWKTTKGVVKGQGLKVTTEEAEKRLTICNSCQFFRQRDQRCSRCGCYMAIKTYLKAESCPVGKW